ncbi:MAG: glycosyl hydrolase family 18 protein [Patescibacteria group bacterium]
MNIKRAQIFGTMLLFTTLLLLGIYSDVQLWHNNTKRIEQIGSIPVAQNGLIAPTPTPQNRVSDKKAVILPNNYWPNDTEEKIMLSASVTTLLLDSPSDDYLHSIQNKYPTLEVASYQGDHADNLCEILTPAVLPESANSPSIIISDGLLTACESDKKSREIFKANCDINKQQCQNDYLIATTRGDYYYNSLNPFLAYYGAALPSVSNPYGTFVFDWSSTLLDNSLLSQAAYSIEVLNESGARIFASGKLATSQKGDYFHPTAPLAPQQLTLILRIWPKIGNTVFSTFFESRVQFSSDLPIENATSYNGSRNIPEEMSWIPDWGMTPALTSIKANQKKYRTLSPVWFTPKANGYLNVEPTLNNKVLLDLVQRNNITLIPTISLFDADILSSILNKHMDTHVKEIVRIVINNNYDGIDLDYESTYASDKEELLLFLSKLSTELHKNSKKLVFTALPKIDDRKIYSFLPQTHEAQDWKAIGAIVDEFRIMAYDFTGQGSKQPGPLSPYGWNETLIRYALSQMPAEKVVLALPLYAHGWPKPKSKNLAGTNNDQSLSSGEQKNTISPQHDNIAYIKNHSTYYRETYDSTIKEVRAEFKYNGVERVMYYLNKQAIDNRLKLAQEYGIKGICYWRIGGEKL